MGKSIPKSRLNITYRTRIDGREVPKKLPLRLLVLADLYAGHPVPMPEEAPKDIWTLGHFPSLDQRPMKSLKEGVSLRSFMTEMQIMAPIMKKELDSVVFGDFSAEVELKLKQYDDASGVIAVRGLGTIEGRLGLYDNHIGAFKGNALVDGDVVDGVKRPDKTKLVFELPQPPVLLWGVVSGDLTGRLGRVERKPNGRIDPKPQPAQSVAVVAPDYLPPGTPPPAPAKPTDPPPKTITVAFDESTGKARATLKAVKVPVMLTIPITDPACFRPEYIASQIPEIHRLLVIKRLLAEMRTYIANNYVFGDALRKVIGDPNQLATIADLTTWLKANFPELAIDTSALAAPAKDAAE